MTDPEVPVAEEPPVDVDEGPVTGVEAAEVTDDDEAPLDVESLIAQLEAVTTERDELQDQVVRSAADFDNFRKRSQRDQAEAQKQAVGRFVDSLLPVLDACDAAAAQGQEGTEPIAKALLAALEQQGLTSVGTVGETFDPSWHEAVLVEPATGGQDSDVVTEVLRTGYRWEDRVLRAAMVKVTG